MGALETFRRRERTIGIIRWALVGIAAGQVLLVSTVPAALSIGVALLLSVQGVAVHRARALLETASAWQRFASIMMLVDVLLAMGYTIVSVRGGSTLAWVLSAVLSMEGALRFRFRGALSTALGSSMAYVLIELAVGTTSGAEIANHVLFIVLIGSFAGAIAFELDVERRLFQRMAFASQDIVGKRDEGGILTALVTHVADTVGSSQASAYRYDFGGWTESARFRRSTGGIVYDAALLDEEGTISVLLHRTTWIPATKAHPGRLTIPIRLPERPAEHVVVVSVPGQRPSALTEGALLSLAEATAVSLGILDVLRHQEASNRRLQRLEVLRTRFVATVAHDLRSPLTTVKGVASILRDRRDSVPPERVDAMLESVERQANRLNRLADDLLDAARLDSDLLELNRELVELRPILISVAADAPDEVETVVDEGVRVFADGPRLERIVWNLVSNAFKYGRPPVVITADDDVADGVIRIRVRDHGHGLATDQMDNLFTDFAAGDDPSSVGLGLAIVWQLTQAHGGTVTYDNADPGAIFTVTLPLTDG